MLRKKIIGKKISPRLRSVLATRKEAQILNQMIKFYGADLSVHVHNSYKSRLRHRGPQINIAAERIVRLKERGIECTIDRHMASVQLAAGGKNSRRRSTHAFPWELRKKDLANIPVLFEFNPRGKLTGIEIFT